MDLHRGGDEEDVANHIVPDLASGCFLCCVDYKTEARSMGFALIRVAVPSGAVLVVVQELIE